MLGVKTARSPAARHHVAPSQLVLHGESQLVAWKPCRWALLLGVDEPSRRQRSSLVVRPALCQ